ncbi:hypothetical protein CHARACLAT_004134 [Characodon lateralis]|uniref:Uncharacterized protein n=1 Tax=Characodon lateralis TaxID=208331 RepID=A0ABU7EQS0_9TELE|nr:hypothetical protein [Characodon lateralis]
MCVHISPRSTTETLYNVCHAHWWCCDTAIETHQKQSKAPGMRRQPMGGKRSNMAAKRRMLVKERGRDTASCLKMQENKPPKNPRPDTRVETYLFSICQVFSACWRCFY